MTNKKGSQAKYFDGLREVVQQHVTLDLGSVENIEAAVDRYLKTQPYLKQVTKNHYSRELIVYIAGQRIVELALETLKRRKETEGYYASLSELRDYIFNKVHKIGLFHIVFSAPELIPVRLMSDYEDYLEKAYNDIFASEEPELVV
ncbi:hypothetical protein ACQKJG_18510 [Priestia megaterium]|uniref:hypothetical protein n=1 Tax=Priestia megaterium TaxID=1404 RepID=UPI003D072106